MIAFQEAEICNQDTSQLRTEFHSPKNVVYKEVL
jgi:hypothetical protein